MVFLRLLLLSVIMIAVQDTLFKQKLAYVHQETKNRFIRSRYI